MKKVITIDIDAQGNSSIDLAGYQGKGCADVAKEFRGSDLVKKSVTKREFSVQVPTQQQGKQQA